MAIKTRMICVDPFEEHDEIIRAVAIKIGNKRLANCPAGRVFGPIGQHRAEVQGRPDLRSSHPVEHRPLAPRDNADDVLARDAKHLGWDHPIEAGSKLSMPDRQTRPSVDRLDAPHQNILTLRPCPDRTSPPARALPDGGRPEVGRASGSGSWSSGRHPWTSRRCQRTLPSLPERVKTNGVWRLQITMSPIPSPFMSGIDSSTAGGCSTNRGGCLSG